MARVRRGQWTERALADAVKLSREWIINKKQLRRGPSVPLRSVEPGADAAPLFDVLAKWATIRGYVLKEITTDPVRPERAKKFVNDGLADGSFKPLIAKTFPLEQIVESPLSGVEPADRQGRGHGVLRRHRQRRAKRTKGRLVVSSPAADAAPCGHGVTSPAECRPPKTWKCANDEIAIESAVQGKLCSAETPCRRSSPCGSGGRPS
jgi:hypothetical protein